MTSSPFFTPQTLAVFLGVSRRTVTYLLSRGEIASFKVAGQRRIAREDVEAYLASVREPVA